MTQDRRGERGFTLLEVLVAIAILAIMSASLVEIERLSLSATERVQHRTQALAHAASLLAEREADARGDGAGVLPDGSRFRITSRARPDLVRPGAAIQPREFIVDVRTGGSPPVRLSSLGWIDMSAR